MKKLTLKQMSKNLQMYGCTHPAGFIQVVPGVDKLIKELYLIQCKKKWWQFWRKY